MPQDPIALWHDIAKTRAAHRLGEVLDDDVVFHSPVVHTPQRGKAITSKYLAAALHVLNNETFRYVGECRTGNFATLEFETVIDGITINGVDLIKWNAAGKIVDFKVMVRPLKAINLLHQLMGARLASAG